MDIRTFAKHVKEHIIDITGLSDENVLIDEIKKTNDRHLTGIAIVEEDSSIGRIIYINDFYDRYLNGETIRNLAHDILSMHKNFTKSEMKDLDIHSKVVSFERCKNDIYCSLVNTEKSKEFLQNIPSVPMEDLSVIFKIYFSEIEGTITINNDMLNIWGMTKEQLFEAVKDNIPEKRTPTIQNIMEIFTGMVDGIKNLFELSEEEAKTHINNSLIPEQPMFVISNETKVDGAYTILLPQTMDRLAELLDDEYFTVLPSSIHEVIAVPMTEDFELYQNMVREVNETELEPQEVLSDTVYVVDVKNKRMIRAEQFEEYKKQLEKGQSLENEYMMVNLVASYEEVFNIESHECVTTYVGDYSMHVLKPGAVISKDLEDKVLDAIGMSKEEFLSTSDFIYRGNIVVALCEKNHIELPEYIRKQKELEKQEDESTPRVMKL